jgi:hypothetical protein
MDELLNAKKRTLMTVHTTKEIVDREGGNPFLTRERSLFFSQLTSLIFNESSFAPVL